MGRIGEGEEGGLSPLHIITEINVTNGKGFRCACGAKWSVPSNATQEYIDEIYQSHVAYFTKPKTFVL